MEFQKPVISTTITSRTISWTSVSFSVTENFVTVIQDTIRQLLSFINGNYILPLVVVRILV